MREMDYQFTRSLMGTPLSIQEVKAQLERTVIRHAKVGFGKARSKKSASMIPLLLQVNRIIGIDAQPQNEGWI